MGRWAQSRRAKPYAAEEHREDTGRGGEGTGIGILMDARGDATGVRMHQGGRGCYDSHGRGNETTGE